MARRPLFAVFALCAWMACSKDKGAADVCDQLGKSCATDNKGEKLAAECKNTPPKAGCEDKTNALYDCYEKELCGKSEKVWALQDLNVLADRKSKCAAERAAVAECVGK